MPTYTKPYRQNNTQLEFKFSNLLNQRPTDLAVRRLAEEAGISQAHARAVLEANEPRHD